MFGGHIGKVSESVKPCLSKNLLAFISEVLVASKSSSVNVSIILGFIPILVRKANNSHKTIKELAEKCLFTLVSNCACEEVIMVFCDLSVDSNIAVSKVGFHALGKMLSDLNNRVADLSPECLRRVFMTLSFNLKSKSVNNKQLSREILLFFKNLMADENFKAYLDMLFNDGSLQMSDGREIVKVLYRKENDIVRLSDKLKNMRMQRASKKMSVKPGVHPGCFQNGSNGRYFN